ncbi:hypothetical protein VitviT2T_020316 [Vitis vinifera]|uniref:Polygalacturonase n=1 Tax=Vitis vinifera TaxID=29760 RepID=A0ABY9D5M6_VITVI|nr:hypothetical protein VitviT2T_020316 [Vitis vinifera]
MLFDLKKIGVGNKTFWLTLYMNYGISRKVSMYWCIKEKGECWPNIVHLPCMDINCDNLRWKVISLCSNLEGKFIQPYPTLTLISAVHLKCPKLRSFFQRKFPIVNKRRRFISSFHFFMQEEKKNKGNEFKNFPTKAQPIQRVVLEVVSGILVLGLLMIVRVAECGRASSVEYLAINCWKHSAVLTNFGGNGDGKKMKIKAFKSAIDHLSECASDGGAEPIVPPGKWLTGSFNLTSHFTLYGEKNKVDELKKISTEAQSIQTVIIIGSACQDERDSVDILLPFAAF